MKSNEKLGEMMSELPGDLLRRAILTVVPSEGLLSMRMVPLCRSTILLQMANPGPLPPVARVRVLSAR